ncbi:MAG TPA: hypothetical protein VMF30_04185 [Pirellulales bacterium]|nr:hypothetical protein [Pirellulales bacterium]
MNRRRSLWHKVAYATAIVVLLLPLSYLSQPRTTALHGGESVGSPGGKLAQLRDEYGLSQADLGELDPTSEALKLVTLGMRGPAANILWQKANEYKKTEDWMGFSAALEQIIRLQPNFINVWRFQAWNLSYNISVEFDDYHDRYDWVMKGINFIIGGTNYNKNEPRLLYDVGWFIAQKIGRADEHLQYRRLFREDDDFNGSRKPSDRDNWLVGREWFLKAQEAVDKLGMPIKGITPLVFHSYPSMALIDYTEAIEDEGTFGEVAKNAWRKSQQSWQEFGDREIPTTYNIPIRLNDYERTEERAHESVAALDELLPGMRDKIRQERIEALSPEDRQIWDTPDGDRTAEQKNRAAQIEATLKPSYLEIAQRADTAKQLEALRLADAATHDEWLAGVIDRYRDIVNFKYWRLHCQVEQTPEALAARKAIYEGSHAFRNSDLNAAKKQYDEGLANWRAVLDAYPELLKETIVVDELVDVIKEYTAILDQHDIEFPEPFVLQDVIDEKNKSPYPLTPKTEKQTSPADVTGPSAEADRGIKKSDAQPETEPPAKP